MITQPDLKITDLIKSKSFTRSAEIVPPRNGVAVDQIVNQIESLVSAGAQFLAVTKGAGGSLRGGSLPIAQLIKERFHVPCIAHFTCRDLLPEEVESSLIDHHLFGIRNILALRGDPPVGEPEGACREGSHKYAHHLVDQIRDLNSGRYLDRAGFKVASREKTQFCIGVACYPDAPTRTERIDYLKAKVDAGAEYAITQMLFDPESYGRYLDECGAAGIEIPILPGIRLARSRPQAERIAKRFGLHAPDSFLESLPATDEKPSLEVALETFLDIAKRLRAYGAPGLHLFILNDIELACLLLHQIKDEIRYDLAHSSVGGEAERTARAHLQSPLRD